MINFAGRLSADLNAEALFREVEEMDTTKAVERLKEAPLRLTLVLADLVRLYRCSLVMEKLEVMRPEVYITGKSVENYRSHELRDVRQGVPDLDMKEYAAKIIIDETGAMTNLEDIRAWCRKFFK